MPKEIIKDKKDIKRVKTYIEGFDEHIQGGIPEGHVVLISGLAGTMKSSLVFNVMYNEALHGKTSLYISLEQSSTSLLNHMINLDFNLDKVNVVTITDLSKLQSTLSKIEGMKGKGAIILADIGALRKQVGETKTDENKDWLNVIMNIIKKVKAAGELDIFCLDSLSALYVLSRFEEPRSKLFYIFESLRDIDVTSFLISEMPLTKEKYSEYEVEDYLSDGIICLDLAHHQRKVVREISVIKMRGTNCNNDVFSLDFKDGKFQALYGGKIPLV
jgi:circadian clock protein KaiC